MTQTQEIQTQSIEFECEIPHPPEKVWRALTESGLVAAWLMENDLRPVVGHRFTFRARPMPGWDGICYCEVLEALAPERLSYSWCGGSTDLEKYGASLDTIVTWTLEKTSSGGTLLRLVHSGFTAKNSFAYDVMSKGWHDKVTRQIAEVTATVA